jgi:hypothetical protein
VTTFTRGAQKFPVAPLSAPLPPTYDDRNSPPVDVVDDDIPF